MMKRNHSRLKFAFIDDFARYIVPSTYIAHIVGLESGLYTFEIHVCVHCSPRHSIISSAALWQVRLVSSYGYVACMY